MKKLAFIIGTLVLIVWQFPQFLLGLLVRLLTGAKRDDKATSLYGVRVFRWGFNSGVSLSGYYIMVAREASQATVLHEKGHALQSLYLGPLYLLVVGIPSIIWASVHRVFKLKQSYYWFYTEAWADKLGGVKR